MSKQFTTATNSATTHNNVNFNLYSNSSSSIDEVNSPATNFNSCNTSRNLNYLHNTSCKSTSNTSFNTARSSNYEDPHISEKFNKFVKKTINKLKLSPVTHTQQEKQSQQSQQSQQEHSHSHHEHNSRQQQQQQVATTATAAAAAAGTTTTTSRPPHTCAISSNSSASDIFERSVSNNDYLTGLANPETPAHYSIENYTSPILDKTTEILANPNIQLDQVKLNCYCDEDYEMDDDDIKPFDPHKHSVGSFQNYSTPSNSEIAQGDAISPTFRPRARSIISQSIISKLDHSKSNNSNNNNNNNNSSSSGPAGKLSLSKSTTGFSFSKPQPLNQPPFLLNKRSSSFAGATRHTRSQSREKEKEKEEGEEEEEEEETVSTPTIDFYSFADMVCNEDDDLSMLRDDDAIDPLIATPTSSRGFINLSGSSTPFRRGSYATINAKDYIGVL
ncbi:hypothetical protein KGF56_004173 [Candida oxycetoniae]|uniref:Uncharacterized protein n=1 Tax=Candida oxycetoniae TaxID=497107 RepID=A0AAI9WWN1_9ASCO|nr:uncharacterized protein KGF56_004173 [Candida oxycetoniae]KAI3403113.2 hypothetical protein KGF56_004173 [Candida oxycetoniae]